MIKNKKLLSLLLILGLGSNLVACSVSEKPSKEESSKEVLVTENKEEEKTDQKMMKSLSLQKKNLIKNQTKQKKRLNTSLMSL